MAYLNKKYKELIEGIKRKYERKDNKILAIIGYGSIAYKNKQNDYDLIVVREKGNLELIKETKKPKKDMVLTSEKFIKKTKKINAPHIVKPPFSAMTCPNILLYEKKEGTYEKLKQNTIDDLVKSTLSRMGTAFEEMKNEKKIHINPKQLALISRTLIAPKIENSENWKKYLKKWFQSKRQGENPFKKIEEFLDPELIKESLIRQKLFIKEEKIPQTNETMFEVKLPKQVKTEKSKKQLIKQRIKLEKLIKKEEEKSKQHAGLLKRIRHHIK